MFTDSVPYTFVFLAYLPYGEDWVDIRSNGFFGSAYKFNGKEKDPETGYNYYGARYYTDRLSVWLSVDPLTDKYPSLSGYNYCANNPVRYIDPDGRDWIDKVAGVIIGTVTNVIPGTSNLRDTYSPNDAGDYNNTLRTVDGVSIVVGGGMMTGGGAGVGAGTSIVIAGGVTASTVVGAPEGAAIAAGGAVVITGSEALMAGGAILTANAATNASKGYDYGNSSQTSTKVKTRQSKGADGATSKHIIEKDAKGKTVSKTHQVTSPDGKVVHQHQDFVSQTPQKGQKPITRQFPDEWVKYPNINTK